MIKRSFNLGQKLVRNKDMGNMKKCLILLSTLLFCMIIIGKNEVKSMEQNYKIFKCNEESGVCIISDKYLKYGLSDKDFNIILPVEYMHISFCKNGDTNIELMRKDENGHPKYGIADKFGKIILEPIYSQIRQSDDFKGKYVISDQYHRKGLADMNTGHIYVEPLYDWFYLYENGDLHIENNDKIGVMNKLYKVIIPTEYESIYLLNGNKYYRLEKQIEFINEEGIKEPADKYGIADLDGKIVVPVECEWIDKGIYSYKYSVTKNGENYIFNSLTGKLEK